MIGSPKVMDGRGNCSAGGGGIWTGREREFKEKEKERYVVGVIKAGAAVPRPPSSSDAALGDSAAINECARFEKRSGAPPLLHVP